MSGNIKDEIILKTSLNSGGQNEEITLLEKFWQISLYSTYVTDDATAKLHVT